MKTQNEYDKLLVRLCHRALTEPHREGFIKSIVDKVYVNRPDLNHMCPRRIAYHVSVCLGCIKYGKEYVTKKNRPHDPVHKNVVDTDSLIAELDSIYGNRVKRSDYYAKW